MWLTLSSPLTFCLPRFAPLVSLARLASLMPWISSRVGDKRGQCERKELDTAATASCR